MNIYKLELNFFPGYETVDAMVVVAADEDEARLVASEETLSGAWLDSKSCDVVLVNVLARGVVLVSDTGA